MGYQPMDKNRALSFLAAEPARPAILSTVRKDGRPHAAPVWYVVEAGAIYFNTGEKTVKGRNLRRTGYAALTVQDDRAPFSFLTAEGAVDLIDDPDQVREWAAKIGGRYVGSDRASEYGERNGVPGELLVKLSIDHFVGAIDVAD